jgi:hypothetical protein
MSIKKKIKKEAGYQCQICGDARGKIYLENVKVEIQAHHIIPKSKGGKTSLENLICLCDFCHAVLHQERHKEFFGKILPEEIIEIFNWYIKLPLPERIQLRNELWKKWGIKSVLLNENKQIN